MTFPFNLGGKSILLGELPVNVLKSYSLPWEADVTEHPTEEFSVADHRVIRPQMLTMECEFMDFVPSLGSIIDAAKGAVYATASWREKRDRLKENFIAGDFVDVTLPEESFNGQIVSVNPDMRRTTTEKFQFTITLKEIRIVKSETEYVSLEDIPKQVKQKETDGQKKANRQKQKQQDKGQAATEETSEKKKSVLAGGIDAIFG
jgi:hypothetical protein